MEINIKVFEMDEVVSSPIVLKSLRRLTLHPYSGMNKALNSFEELRGIREINAKAIVAFQNNIIVGWALYSWDIATDTFRYNPENGICFQIYTSLNFRRKGIGSKLLIKATEIAGENLIRVYHLDAYEFFKLHKIAGKNIETIYKDQSII